MKGFVFARRPVEAAGACLYLGAGGGSRVREEWLMLGGIESRLSCVGREGRDVRARRQARDRGVAVESKK